MTMKKFLAAALSLAVLGGFGLAGSKLAVAADLGDVSIYDQGDGQTDIYAHVGYKKKRPYYYDNNNDAGVGPGEPVYINPPPGTDGSTYSNGDDNVTIFGNPPATVIYGNENSGETAVDSECLSNRAIRARLVDQGWRKFHGLAINADVVGLTASRPNGLTYRLKIDRCSGVIIATYLLQQPQRRQNRYSNQGY